MANSDLSFQLDVEAAQEIITTMAAPLVKSSADAIASRAQSIAGSLSSEPISMKVSTRIGTIKRGTRAIATVTAVGADAHQNYIGHQALTKSKDAGRV